MKGRQLDLEKALQRLAHAGLTEVLVEGGAALAASLLRAGLVDELHWFCAPKLIGGDGVDALGTLGVSVLADASTLEVQRVTRMGADLYVKARVHGSGESE
jgi:diaminohydroxyphosphoribosylaminopyrimidine deaminase/5-amino-6-(5-phosphoribosylamino)uracil reductase